MTDFTYVRSWAGWVYVAFILDVFSQRIVAWHAATNKDTDLVMIPLRMALWERDREGHPVGAGQLIHHSDAGSQYTSILLTEHLALEGIAASIGSVGDAYDNALMETINGLYKAECVRTTVFHAGPYKTIADVEYATAGWVDWYNNRRLHGSLGMVSPLRVRDQPTTRPSTESRNPHRSGTKPRAVHPKAGSASTPAPFPTPAPPQRRTRPHPIGVASCRRRCRSCCRVRNPPGTSGRRSR